MALAAQEAEMSAAPKPSTLSALLDIELPLTLRFGQAQMHLDDILNLDTDSMVELDRASIEPVDVLVNGRLVARGMVVEVDGNYAIQIAEISSRQERLNTTAGAV